MTKSLINYLFIVFSIITISCCDDDMTMEPDRDGIDCSEIDCLVIEEFYGKGMVNSACWTTDLTNIDHSGNTHFSITLWGETTNGIDEQLRIRIINTADLNDTIWLGWVDFANPSPNIASARYFYTEGSSFAGDFDFGSDSELTYDDYLLIDSFNADTSIVEGRFKVRFPRRNINNFVTHAPDTMRIECGSFRVKEL